MVIVQKRDSKTKSAVAPMIGHSRPPDDLIRGFVPDFVHKCIETARVCVAA